MALVNKTVTGLINGVSTQPFQLRLDSQGDDMINCQADISRGIRRRKGSEFQFKYTIPGVLAEQLNDAYHHVFHFINRDRDNQFLVHISGGTSGTPASLTIHDLSDGTAQTVTLGTGAATFLAQDGSNNVNETFRLITVADTTWIVKNSLTPAMAGTTSPNPADWGMIHVKAGINGITYSVTLRNATDPLPKTSTYTADPTGAINTDTVAAGLLAAINTTWTAEAQKPVLERFGSSIAIKWDDESAFTMSTTDGFGNTALTHAKTKGKVQAFSELPPIAFNGLITEVQGDPDVEADNYFVEFETADGDSQETSAMFGGSVRQFGTGVWKETVKWNTATTIDNTTMPYKLVHTPGTVNWNIDPVTWGLRTVGDTDTAPNPSFIGQKIRGIEFHKNRLALLAGESVVFSAVDDFEQFFPTTVVTLSDDDRIDITADFDEVARFEHAISFSDAVILFADSGVYAVRGSPDGFSATTVTLEKIAAFDGRIIAPPVPAGDRIFFATHLVKVGADQSRKAQVKVFELTPSPATDAFIVEPINEHALGFIPDQRNLGSPMLSADGGLNMLAYQPSLKATTEGHPEMNAVYIYQYFTSNREKVQSAWHKWDFGYYTDDFGINASRTAHPLADGYWMPRVIRGAFINGYFYTVSDLPSAGGSSDFHDIVVSRVAIATQNLDGAAFGGRSGSGGSPPFYDPPLTEEPFIDYFQNDIIPSSFDGTHTLFEVQGEWVSGFVGAPGSVVQVPLANMILIEQNLTPGLVHTVAEATLTGATAGNTILKVLGDLTSPNQIMTFGLAYRSQYVFSSPALKTPQNQPIVGGRTLLRRLKMIFRTEVNVTSFTTPEDFQVAESVTLSKTQTHSAKRVIEKAIHKDNDQVKVGFYSVDPDSDFELVGAEWGIDFTNNARNL